MEEKEILIKKTQHLTTAIIELINNVDNAGIQVGALSLGLATNILNTCKSFEESMQILNHITSEIKKVITSHFHKVTLN